MITIILPPAHAARRRQEDPAARQDDDPASQSPAGDGRLPTNQGSGMGGRGSSAAALGYIPDVYGLSRVVLYRQPEDRSLSLSLSLSPTKP